MDEAFPPDERLPDPARLRPSYPRLPEAAAIVHAHYASLCELIEVCRARYGRGCLVVQINFAERIEYCRWVTTDLAATRDPSVPVILGQIYPEDQLAWIVDRLAERQAGRALENVVQVTQELMNGDLLPFAFLVVPIGQGEGVALQEFTQRAAARWCEMVTEVTG